MTTTFLASTRVELSTALSTLLDTQELESFRAPSTGIQYPSPVSSSS